MLLSLVITNPAHLVSFWKSNYMVGRPSAEAATYMTVKKRRSETIISDWKIVSRAETENTILTALAKQSTAKIWDSQGGEGRFQRFGRTVASTV
jgi:hypothetical protein